jgi:hypothetical protein
MVARGLSISACGRPPGCTVQKGRAGIRRNDIQ